MHDTLLFKKLSQEIDNLCELFSINKVTEITIGISRDLQIDNEHLLVHFIEEGNKLIDEWTRIIIEKEEDEVLTAIIKSIEGEKSKSYC